MGLHFSPVPGIDETVIETLVRRFYGKVRRDPELGPIFAAAITDWEAHLQKMFAFWSSVTLMSGRYKGHPMQAHQKLTTVDREHFGIWLDLFRETAREVCEPQAADLFIAKAERIAQSLQLAMFYNPQEAVK